MNAKWRHFSTIRASDLLALDVDDATVMDGPDAPDASAWTIHGTLHRMQPAARVILHAHPPHATALATLGDPSKPPIDMNTARFFGDLAIDHDCGGIADDAAEGARIAAAFDGHSTLLMANHGVTCTASTVARAFEQLYYFERAAQTVLLARGSGQPLRVMPDEIAARTALG